MTVRDSPRGGARPSPSTPLAKGATVGRYVIEGVLGEGGMGVVYAANDPELVRKVALKLVLPGGGPDAQARLVREAQAMARLAHPNVVAIYDVGGYEGRVFIAMELVAGENARDWLAREPRQWRRVVELFRGAGRGLAAAHAAGIVHRDFKLDNVLVDGDGRARVTDFGLARAVDDAVAPASEALPSPSVLDAPITVTGAVLGTPAYMAPEQRSPSTKADGRADEFSFCVSMFEALYGERPFEGANSQPPAGSRVPRWVRNIVLQGMADKPEERWPSMDALLSALDRDPARTRRRVALAGVGVALAAAVVVLALRGHSHAPGCDDAEAAFADAWSPARRDAIHGAFAATGVAYAEREFATTRERLDRAATAWKAARIEACRAQPQEVSLLRMACLERQRSELRALVDALATADTKTVEVSAQAAEALPRPSECEHVQELVSVKPPADPKIRAEIESLRLELASAVAVARSGHPLDAEPRIEPIVARAKQLGYRPFEAEAQFALGIAHSAIGRGAGVSAYQDAMLAAEAGHADRLAARAAVRTVAKLAGNTRLAEAEQAIARARALVERIGGDREIEAEIEQEAGFLDLVSGNLERAEPTFKRALAIFEQTLGPDDAKAVAVRGELAALYADEAKAELAIEYGSSVVAALERTLGPEHPNLIVPLANLGYVHLKLGELDEAAPLLDRAYKLGLATVGPDTYRTGAAALYLSQLELARGQVAEALTHAQAAVAGYRAGTGEKSRSYGWALVQLGAALLANGNVQEAVDSATSGIVLAEHQGANGLAHDLTIVGEIQLAAGHPQDALATLERALDLSGKGPHYPVDDAITRFAAARALVATRGDRARARELAQQARDELASQPHYAAVVAKIDAFLKSARKR